MAKRTLNRRQLRQDAEAAEKLQPTAPADPAEPAAEARAQEEGRSPQGQVAGNAAAETGVQEERAGPDARRWGVFDGGMKQVAVFDYNERGAADQKLDDLLAKKGGTFFLQMVKEPMPTPPPAAAPPA